MWLLNHPFAGVLMITFSSASFAFRGCCITRYPRASTRIKQSTATLNSAAMHLKPSFTNVKDYSCWSLKRETYSTTLFASNASAPKRNNDGSSTNSSITFSSGSAKTYRLEGSGRGTKIEAKTNTGHSLVTDIPKYMGGGDTAAQPVETLLVAWMGCTQATASFVGRQILMERARSQGERRRARTEVVLEFDNIEAFRDERGALDLPIRQTPIVPSRLQRITGTIKVSLLPAVIGKSEDASTKTILDPEELETLKEQTEIRCPIANMIVESGCAMDVEWVQE